MQQIHLYHQGFLHFYLQMNSNMSDNTEITGLYINPLTDFGFKRIFGDEEIMMDFLNDLIEPQSPIVAITFIDKDAQA